MYFSYYKWQFGILEIGYNENGIITSIKNVHNILNKDEKNFITDDVFNQIKQYLQGDRKTFDFKFILKGTDFQIKVWKSLLKIPYGKVKTYKDIAKDIGNIKACRAVGMANNKNNLLIVVPCHRVIGSNNRLIGYRCGLDIKKALLNIEGNYFK